MSFNHAAITDMTGTGIVVLVRNQTPHRFTQFNERLAYNVHMIRIHILVDEYSG